MSGCGCGVVVLILIKLNFVCIKVGKVIVFLLYFVVSLMGLGRFSLVRLICRCWDVIGLLGSGIRLCVKVWIDRLCVCLGFR